MSSYIPFEGRGGQEIAAESTFPDYVDRPNRIASHHAAVMYVCMYVRQTDTKTGTAAVNN